LIHFYKRYLKQRRKIIKKLVASTVID